MIKIKKTVLVILVILGVVCGGLGMYALQSTGLLALATGGGHLLSDAEYTRYTQLSQNYGKLEELRNYVQNNYYERPEEDLLYEGIYKGLFAILGDPYSGYMTAEEYEQEQISITGNYSGIGATLMKNDNNHVEIISIAEDSPAEKAGLRKGDEVLEVDGVAYTGDELDSCASHIRGEEGTVVKIHFLRKGEPMDLAITRGKIINKSVKYEMLNDKVGCIKLSAFEERTAKDFGEALAAIEKSGAESFVLDMRDNGGGLVDQALSIADMLMEKGTVIYVEDQKGNREYYKTNAGRTKLKYVVLVNEASASATEILSAGIQDNNEAEIVGVQSFGKGIIQDIQPLSDGSGIKLTVLQYYSPSGNKIHGVGITPDYVVELPEDCYNEDGELIKDLQMDKALNLLGY